MDLQGNLENFGLPEIFQLLSSAQKTGGQKKDKASPDHAGLAAPGEERSLMIVVCGPSTRS